MDLISALTCITVEASARNAGKMKPKESATMTAQTEAAKTETATPAKKASTQVSATLTPNAYKRLDDYRWDNRINKTSEVVAEAIDFFLAAKGAEPAQAVKGK